MIIFSRIYNTEVNFFFQKRQKDLFENWLYGSDSLTIVSLPMHCTLTFPTLDLAIK